MKKLYLLFSLFIFLVSLINNVSSVKNHLPVTVLAQPQDTSIINNLKQKFSWNFYDQDNDIQGGYVIYLSEDIRFSSPIVIKGYGSNKYTYIDIPAKDQTYYWAVKTYDGKEWGEISSIYSFTLDTTKKICKDGTEFYKCNQNFQYCDGGVLITKCTVCGCPSGYECKDLGWKQKCILMKCPDGTSTNQCNNELKYCENGTLIDKCDICGCPSGYTCQDGACTQVIEKEEIKEKTIWEKIMEFIKSLF